MTEDTTPRTDAAALSEWLRSNCHHNCRPADEHKCCSCEAADTLDRLTREREAQAAELREANAELQQIDYLMARRPALDKPTRWENIQHAINTAAVADRAERLHDNAVKRADKAEAERDALTAALASSEALVRELVAKWRSEHLPTTRKGDITAATFALCARELEAALHAPPSGETAGVTPDEHTKREQAIRAAFKAGQAAERVKTSEASRTLREAFMAGYRTWPAVEGNDERAERVLIHWLQPPAPEASRPTGALVGLCAPKPHISRVCERRTFGCPVRHRPTGEPTP